MFDILSLEWLYKNVHEASIYQSALVNKRFPQPFDYLYIVLLVCGFVELFGLVICLYGLVRYSTFHKNIKLFGTIIGVATILIILCQIVFCILYLLKQLTPLENFYLAATKLTFSQIIGCQPVVVSIERSIAIKRARTYDKEDINWVYIIVEIFLFFYSLFITINLIIVIIPNWIPYSIMALCNIIALAHFQKLKINLNNQWNEEKEDKTSINYRFQLIENFKTFYVVQGINFGVSLVDLSAIPIFLIADAVAIVTFILTIFFGSTNTQMLRKVFCRNIKTKMIQTSIKENNDNETNIHFAQMKLAWEKLK